MFNDKLYDKLKFVDIIVLPSLATLYLGLGQLWNFPATDKVGASIALLAVFLGSLLQISSSKFKNNPDGYLNIGDVDEDSVNPRQVLTITKHPDDLADKKTVVLKVGKPPKAKPPVEH